MAGTALVTGATSGIGLSIARQLAGRGHDIVLVARHEDVLEETAAALRKQFGVGTEVLVADLATSAGREAAAARAADTDRPLEWLVNNAGFGLAQSFTESDVADEVAMIEVLVTAPMQLTHAALPGMLARKRGRVLIVSSVASFMPIGTYSAAKAWATMFAESMSIAYTREGVNFTALCPGFTHTEFHQRAGMDMESIPKWMWLDADAVAAAGINACIKGSAKTVPGASYKGMVALAPNVPTSIMGRLLGGFR